jgi:hypothetical protein
MAASAAMILRQMGIEGLISERKCVGGFYRAHWQKYNEYSRNWRKTHR